MHIGPIGRILAMPELENVAEQLRALVRWSIRIECDEPSPDDLDPGISKFGGLPDLPDGVEWPAFSGPRGVTAIALVAQIRLSDVAPFDRERALPEQGWLWFFSDMFGLYKIHGYEAAFEGRPADRVLFVPDEGIALRRRERPQGMYDERPWRARGLRFRAEQTLPHVETAWIGDRGKDNGLVPMTHDEWDAYADARQELARPGKLHRMLGYSDDMQPGVMERGYRRARPYLFPELGSIADDAGMDEECRQGRLLFQVESQDDMAFGRWGCGAFFIRADDLQAARFDRVWFNEA